MLYDIDRQIRFSSGMNNIRTSIHLEDSHIFRKALSRRHHHQQQHHSHYASQSHRYVYLGNVRSSGTLTGNYHPSFLYRAMQCIAMNMQYIAFSAETI